jgi:hypothetical protein
MNVASIAIGDLAGAQTVKRTVTNVSRSRSVYKAAVTGMAGIDVKVTPASFVVKPGRSFTFYVTFTRTTAPTSTYTEGHLTLSDGNHDVRLPLVVRPVALAAPPEVSSAGGPISYDVKFGYTGAFSATPRGLVPALTADGAVEDDPEDSFDPNGPGVTGFQLGAPAGMSHLRFSLFEDHVTAGADLDLYLFRVVNNSLVFVAGSGNTTSNEEVNVLNPTPGTYIIFVHGFNVPTPPGTADFTLFAWMLGTTADGSMTVNAPTTATTGATGTINLSFTGLTTGTKYLGSVAYSGTTNMPNPTIVRVDP